MSGHHAHRKADHIRINLDQDVDFPNLTTGLEHYRFMHQALPELDLDKIDISLTLFGKRLQSPILISSMTGGTAEAGRINLHLAEAAEAAGIAMGLGSQRAGLEESEQAATFQVRRVAPTILLFANLGAVQLNKGYTVEHCQRVVEMVEADALILHLNPLQEAVQAGGDVHWAGLARKIEAVCTALSVPVIAKEVGWGISVQTARLLADVGVAAIDVAGAGGTSWSEVEYHRAPLARLQRLARVFADWGIPTAESLRLVHEAVPEMTLFASGGLRTGIDIAKCLALGADLCGMAGPFLRPATESAEAVASEIDAIVHELTVAMFAVGAGTVQALREPGRLVGPGRQRSEVGDRGSEVGSAEFASPDAIERNQE
ncbi:MAG TPA: type 2 isopentenyl-diphosphate Delta-isomerase [Caldilineae bacterium]|nr:type 2 isopentenyl-diphosphate Delta-isomerase [Caldilineae bacterium]